MDTGGLSESLRKLLKEFNMNDAEDILQLPISAFERMGIREKEIIGLKTEVAKGFFNKFQTATELNQQIKHISFGCAALDSITHNGISTRGITEICGISGSGKSQICLQLALTVQLGEELGGLGKGAVFICTENAFPSKRLIQLASSFSKRVDSIAEPFDFLDNIFIEHVPDSESLQVCVSTFLPQLLSKKPIGLVIIDSVGAVYRLETNAVSRANDMRRLILDLQKLSYEHGCAVICINQVTSVIGSNVQGDDKVIPCLGLAWSNLVTHRFQIHKTNDFFEHHSFDETGRIIEKLHLTTRKFEINFSPELPPKSVEFLISPEGIVDIPEQISRE